MYKSMYSVMVLTFLRKEILLRIQRRVSNLFRKCMPVDNRTLLSLARILTGLRNPWYIQQMDQMQKAVYGGPQLHSASLWWKEMSKTLIYL